MKIIFVKFNLILLLLALSVATQAQITLTRSDFPRPTPSSTLPDSVLITNIISGTTTSQSLAGPSQVWSELNVSGNPTYQNFVPLSSTSLFLQLAFLSCDYAQPLIGGASVAGSPLTDAYEFYNYAASDSRLELKGFGGNVTIPGSTTPLPLPAVYSPSDILIRFPATFGDTCSSTSGFNVTLPLPTFGNVTFKRNQTRMSEVDGWGTIQVPTGGLYDVLRIKSIINRVDSILTPIFPIGLPSLNHEYKWIGKGNKVPVLQINTVVNGGNETPTQRFYLGGWPASVHESTMQEDKYSLWPNPGSSAITISIPKLNASSIECVITNMNGQQVGKFNFKHTPGESFQEQVPVFHLSNGIYQITCKAEGFLRTQKLVKQ